MQTFIGRFYGTKNPAVAWGIQNITGYAGDIRHIFEEEAAKLLRILEEGDEFAFNSFYFKNAANIGDPNLQIASEDSDRIVALLKELGHEARFNVLVKETRGFLEDRLHGIADKLDFFGYLENRRQEKPDDKTEVPSELMEAGKIYGRVELCFRRGDYSDSRRAAVDLRHMYRKLIVHLRRFNPEKLSLLTDFEENLSRYISLCDRIRSYEKSITPTLTNHGGE